MSNTKKMLPDMKPGGMRAVLEFFSRFRFGGGLLGLLLVLAFLSFLCVYEWRPVQRVYVQGEVAESDIAAPYAFSFQDIEATNQKRAAAEKAEPLICVLNLEPVEKLHRRITELFIAVNQADDAAELDQLRLVLSDEIGEEISTRMFALLRDPDVQALASGKVLPWLEQRLREGVASDSRSMLAYTGGIIVRDLKTGETVARMAPTEVTDVRNAMLDLSVYVRNLPTGAQTKRLFNTLFSGFITATLTPNFEATAYSAAEAARMVNPVVQNVMAGEIIVRQGERITQDQIGKLRALWSRESQRFNPELFFGIFLCAVLLCGGIFYSPTGKSLDKVGQRDLLFIAFLLAFFTILAKGFFHKRKMREKRGKKRRK